MTRDEVKKTIVRFIEFIEDTKESGRECEDQLALYLDQLAMSIHFNKVAHDKLYEADPPRKDYKEDNVLVVKKFPDFGYYNVVLNVIEKVGEPEYATGDAIDDIADIYGDLKEVIWRWENNSPEDALYHHQFLFRIHWGLHLRNLQLYLIERESEDDGK